MKILLASTSTVYSGRYLDYILPELKKLFNAIGEILFIPYARPSGMTLDAYTDLVRKTFAQINIKVKGIHEFNDSKDAIRQAKGIFTGGGNTFLLVKQLYENDLMDLLRETIQKGVPYFGTSAGSNIAGQNMQNTNDMPIVFVPSYQTLGLVPFNINPHYLDPAPDLLKHMGETRETRIKEYLHFNTTPVVALREGSWIESDGVDHVIKGILSARVYLSLTDIREINPETNIKNLLA